MSIKSLYINGEWLASADGGTREIRSPHDNSLVTTVSEGTTDDAISAIAAARAAFDSGIFSSKSISERSSLVSRIADLLERDCEILAKLESGDTAKRLIEARYDMADVVSTFRHFAKIGLQVRDRSVEVGIDNISSKITHEPVGVCSLIGPWNYPLLQISWKVAPALVAEIGRAHV